LHVFLVQVDGLREKELVTGTKSTNVELTSLWKRVDENLKSFFGEYDGLLPPIH